MTTRLFDLNRFVTLDREGSRLANSMRTHDAPHSVSKRRELSFHALEPNRATCTDAASRRAVVIVASFAQPRTPRVSTPDGACAALQLW